MLEFLSLNWPIVVCLLCGTGLLVLEMFMPGIGLPGISGLLLELVAVGITWNNYGPLTAVGMLIVILAVVGIGISISIKSASSGRLSKSSLVLNDTVGTENGVTAAYGDLSTLVGREGVTATTLRPAGVAEFDGVRLDVVSDGAFVQQGVKVRIDKIDGARIIIKVLS